MSITIGIGSGTFPVQALLHAADWGTATGQTTSALTDGGRAGIVQADPGPDLIDIVNADTAIAGLPSHWPTNLMEIDINGGDSHMVGWTRDAPWAAPAVGETLWFRWISYHSGQTWEGEFHSPEACIGDIAWAILENSGTSTFDVGFKTYLAGQDNGTIEAGGHAGFRVSVSTQVPYRYELGIEKVSGTTVRFHPEYRNDATGALVADANNLVWQGTGDTSTFAGSTLADFQNGGGVFNYDGITDGIGTTTTQAERDGAMFKSMLIGQQGPGGASNVTGILWHGALAVALNQRCGTYVPGEADPF